MIHTGHLNNDPHFVGQKYFLCLLVNDMNAKIDN